MKAQVLAGGRGKAGLVRTAESLEEARASASSLLTEPESQGILVEEKIQVERELFAAITLDRKRSLPVLMLSLQGGMDVEEANSESFLRVPFEGVERWSFYKYVDLLISLGFKGKALMEASGALRALERFYFEEDVVSAEINPLAVAGNGSVWALDAKIVFDDAAIFRHSSWKDLRSHRLERGQGLELEARQMGLSYVFMPGGDIGVISGGAGLAMATMDAVSIQGGKPAAFLDIGGGVTEEAMAESLRIVRQSPGVRGLLINVFGGINNCQVMARGIVRDLGRQGFSRVPLVVKTRGHFQEEGWAILEGHGVEVVKYGTTDEAVHRLLRLMAPQKE